MLKIINSRLKRVIPEFPKGQTSHKTEPEVIFSRLSRFPKGSDRQGLDVFQRYPELVLIRTVTAQPEPELTCLVSNACRNLYQFQPDRVHLHLPQRLGKYQTPEPVEQIVGQTMKLKPIGIHNHGGRTDSAKVESVLSLLPKQTGFARLIRRTDTRSPALSAMMTGTIHLHVMMVRWKSACAGTIRNRSPMRLSGNTCPSASGLRSLNCGLIKTEVPSACTAELP